MQSIPLLSNINSEKQYQATKEYAKIIKEHIYCNKHLKLAIDSKNNKIYEEITNLQMETEKLKQVSAISSKEILQLKKIYNQYLYNFDSFNFYLIFFYKLSITPPGKLKNQEIIKMINCYYKIMQLCSMKYNIIIKINLYCAKFIIKNNYNYSDYMSWAHQVYHYLKLKDHNYNLYKYVD